MAFAIFCNEYMSVAVPACGHRYACELLILVLDHEMPVSFFGNVVAYGEDRCLRVARGLVGRAMSVRFCEVTSAF